MADRLAAVRPIEPIDSQAVEKMEYKGTKVLWWRLTPR